MIKSLTGRIEKDLSTLNLPGHLPDLYDPISYTLSLGGKRIRPVMLLLSARIFGVDYDQALNQALGVEMFHNFTLIHDDIMDNAPLRRGKATVYKKWNTNTAILSGDVLYALATQYVSKCQPHHLPSILSTFIEMTIKVCEGQQLDMEFEKRTPTMEEYMEMIKLKTAFLLAGSMKIGAILGGASAQNCEAAFEYGIKIGIAFQLMDDYLDVFGDPENFGKQVGGDIISGKKTYLFIQCANLLSGNDKDEFLRTFNDTTMESSKKVKTITQIFIDSGVQMDLKKEVDRLMNSSDKILLNINGNEEATKELINLSHLLTNRNS